MDINATLFGQMITFALFVWFTMKFIWPPLTTALSERQKKIADGLAAAEQGVLELEKAQHRANEILRDAKIKAAEILDKAGKQANLLVEEAKETARSEGERLTTLAKAEIKQEKENAKIELRKHVANLALLGAERIIKRNMDAATHSHIVDQLISEIQ